MSLQDWLGLIQVLIVPGIALVAKYAGDTSREVRQLSERMVKMETLFGAHDRWERDRKYHVHPDAGSDL